MKRCPTCRRTFADDTLSFCLVDGSILSAPYDHQATAADSERRGDSAPLTEFMPPELSRGRTGGARYVIWTILALAFVVLNICLLVPIVNRGMSWEEAALGLVPGALVAFICFVLLLAGVGLKGGKRTRASRLWLAALLWSLLVGSVVTYTTTTSYAMNVRLASSESMTDYKRSYSSLYDAYARHDRIGMLYGWLTLGFAGVSLMGLIVSVALRKRA